MDEAQSWSALDSRDASQAGKTPASTARSLRRPGRAGAVLLLALPGLLAVGGLARADTAGAQAGREALQQAIDRLPAGQREEMWRAYEESLETNARTLQISDEQRVQIEPCVAGTVADKLNKSIDSAADPSRLNGTAIRWTTLAAIKRCKP